MYCVSYLVIRLVSIITFSCSPLIRQLWRLQEGRCLQKRFVLLLYVLFLITLCIINYLYWYSTISIGIYILVFNYLYWYFYIGIRLFILVFLYSYSTISFGISILIFNYLYWTIFFTHAFTTLLIQFTRYVLRYQHRLLDYILTQVEVADILDYVTKINTNIQVALFMD